MTHPPGASCAASCQLIAECRRAFPELRGSENECQYEPSRFVKNELTGGHFTPGMRDEVDQLQRGDFK